MARSKQQSQEIRVGDHVEFSGDTQDYILTEPDKVYRGKVIGKEKGQLLVRLETPVTRGQGQFHEATVLESRVRAAAKKK
jgi:hypothetical protein